MQGMNCVGVFYDSEKIVSAAYAGSPEYIIRVFRQSLDPKYVFKDAYDKLIDGSVGFVKFSCYDEKGIRRMTSARELTFPWKQLSAMSDKEILHLFYTKTADSNSPQFSDILEYPVYAYLKETSDENK